MFTLLLILFFVVAVIVTSPVETPLTNPLLDTVAMLSLLDDHVIVVLKFALLGV